MVKIRKFRRANRAVAGVVVGMLFLGFIVSAVAFIEGVYVPKWMEEKEAQHMNTVNTQFSQIKSSVDMLSVLSKKHSIISNPITLGTEENPFLFSSRSYGSIEINPNDCKIIIENAEESYEFLLGSLKYSSENVYFIDQSFAYEGNAVILSQYSGDIVVIKPSIIVVNNKDLSFDLVRLIEKTGKSSASGSGTYPVQTMYSESQEIDILQVHTITIYNTHLGAWMKFFKNLFSDYQDLNPNIEYNNDNTGVVINFDSTPNLYLRLSDIDIQISSGWIE